MNHNFPRVSGRWVTMAAAALPLATLGCAIQSAPVSSSGESSDSLAGGRAARVGERPAAGYLVSSAGHLHCGVTRIDHDLVLTAAHCVDEEEFVPTEVGFGTYESAAPIPVADVFIHPGWNRDDEQVVHDLAVIRLATSDRDAASVDPSVIPAPVLDGEDAIRFEFVGYGREHEGGRGVGFYDRRKVGQVELYGYSQRQLLVTGVDSMWCAADSGSGIYEQTSGALVAVVGTTFSDACRFSPGDDTVGSAVNLEGYGDFLACAARDLHGVRAPAAFPDTACHWANAHLQALRDAGIVAGDTRGGVFGFRPGDFLTREELAALLANAFELTPNPAGPQPSIRTWRKTTGRLGPSAPSAQPAS